MDWDETIGPSGLFVRRSPVRHPAEVTSQEDAQDEGTGKALLLVPGRMRRSGRAKGTRDQLRPGYGELVDEFLTRTARVPPDEVARIVGVNPATVQRWRLLGVRKVTGVTLSRMMQYLA